MFAQFPPLLRAALALGMTVLTSQAADVRVGMIGLDTSHATEFTARLNDPASTNYVPGARVVVAMPQASADLPMSKDRIDAYTAEVHDKFGVRIVFDIKELLDACDAVMILSLDGRAHPAQVKSIVDSKKPIFLDKPVAASLRDCVRIYEMAEEAGAPIFSASSLRWYPGLMELAVAKIDGVSGAFAYGPAPKQPEHPTLFFYGIHPTEALFTVLGTGCTTVTSLSSEGATVVTARWADGRIGTLYAMHTWPADYKVTLFGKDKVLEQKIGVDYTPLVREIVKFFLTKQPPVSPAKTLEIYAFMQAADESIAKSGRAITLSEVLSKAECPAKWLVQSKLSKPSSKDKARKGS